MIYIFDCVTVQTENKPPPPPPSLETNQVVSVPKGGEIREQKPSTCRATLFRCTSVDFPVFYLRDQLVAQQKHLLRVEEMRRADWLIR